jgi:hypothetical protein
VEVAALIERIASPRQLGCSATHARVLDLNAALALGRRRREVWQEPRRHHVPSRTLAIRRRSRSAPSAKCRAAVLREAFKKLRRAFR